MDCNAHTPYVFILLNRRLCQKCENGNPRYSLITQAQALEMYGITPSLLAGLPCRELRGVLPPQQEKRLRACGQATLYLRGAVEELSAQQRVKRSSGAVGGSSRPSSSRRPDAESDDVQQFQLDEDIDSNPRDENDQAACSELDAATTDDEHVDGERGRARAAKPTPEEAKAARKAAKAAVKAANRAKRASFGEATGTSPLVERVALGTSPGATFSGARSAGARGGGAPRGRDGNRPPRERDAASWSRSYGTSPPVQSGPRARALVDDALGEFAISGLELSL